MSAQSADGMIPTTLASGFSAHRLAAAALAGVGGIGSRRLRFLLAHADPVEVWASLCSGSVEPCLAALFGSVDLDRAVRHAQHTSLAELADRWGQVGVEIAVIGEDAYPGALATDLDPPPVIFTKGRINVLDARRVAVIGTRNATSSGLATARDLGRALAQAEVAVVSGLARGIDGAVHRGVHDVRGRAIGVVGNGLDQAYPRRNVDIWEWVGSEGYLVSEWPPGTPPDGWRFPRRNRIIAALSEIVVVVESRERGGSLITVDEALKRDVQVMAVPGSPRSRAAAGTNQLLVDGAAPVTGIDDILVALGLDHECPDRGPIDVDLDPASDEAQVVEWCARAPATLDDLVTLSGLPIAAVAMAVARLERDSIIVVTNGWCELARPRWTIPIPPGR
ncbi:MAG: DNA-protecting protein DprA [Ilumatobacter coccineus]|uniref:DNA-protecting protein DprA n=1 Tax=Ilumatobacter coccineus TaxID=467094 RepID=A0A2G6KDB7_9ACTN|nr:MAG: DNA-protecting protein DprA [Ilumatobacter coccineus]